MNTSIEENAPYNLSFAINEEEKTASIIDNENANGDILIPISFDNEGEKFIITSIAKHSFENSKIQYLEIPSDSKLKTIEEESFTNSTINSISIPSSVIELKDGWCLKTPKLTQILISPNNQRYIYFEDKIIVGKSDIKSDLYDELIFARRNIVSVVIPSFIKRIASYAFSESSIEKIFISPNITKISKGAFYGCHKLKKVEISAYSELQKIETLAFSDTPIESITIPPIENIYLEDGWCEKSVKIIKINNKDLSENEQKVTPKKLQSEKEIVNSLQCPICYLAMMPPERTPMIISECGHSICEQCIAKLKECPICHHKITFPVKNILAIQLIESIDKNQLIPKDINPPAPFTNKLIPKIEPFCTFFTSGEKFNLKQPFYKCLTCNPNNNNNNGFCEICINKCHKGHKILLDNNNTGSFCDCVFFGKCKCCSIDSNSHCTLDLTYQTPIEQPMYQCQDCHIVNDLYLCQNCAMKCHFGHKMEYKGMIKNKLCRCFDHCNCQISERKPICTFAHTGRNYAPQPYYNCYTCGLTGNKGCCAACAFNCHQGHSLSFSQFSDKFFCDCGCGTRCNIINNCNSSYLTSCPNFLFSNKDKKIKQRKYNCLTCGIFDSLGICEGCAINCHINHLIEFVGIEEFCCACKSSNKCKMELNPLLHNDRSQCDRLTLEKEDISACYTCFNCDKSGLIKICETCALKNHLDHDIHLLGYMKFDCHG